MIAKIEDVKSNTYRDITVISAVVRLYDFLGGKVLYERGISARANVNNPNYKTILEDGLAAEAQKAINEYNATMDKINDFYTGDKETILATIASNVEKKLALPKIYLGGM